MGESTTKELLKQKADMVAKKEKPTTIKWWIAAYQGELEQALPNIITIDRFMRIALGAVSKNPKLAECTPSSLIGALLQCAQLGLEPNTVLGQAYVLPYNNNRKVNNQWVKVMEATFQLGYPGILDLAYRTDKFKYIDARVVKENDLFEYSYGLEKKLIHVPAMTNRGKVIYYYAAYELFNGGTNFDVMSKEDAEDHGKKFAPAYASSKSGWKTNFDAMAKKTVLIQVLKYAPKAVELQKAAAGDNTIKSDIAGDMLMLDNEMSFDDKSYIEAPDEPESNKTKTPKKNTVDKETGEIKQTTIMK
jgi:recombination protein RecT